jgi:endonuclease/exonuclease/phosphatase family metal-dependent hydrolase
VVLQEAPLPAGGVAEGELWFGNNPRVGVVVAGFNGFRVTPGPESAVHAAYPVRVNGPASFHLLAVWTKHTTKYLEGLAAELDRHRGFLLARPAVVTGDFNSNTIWDKPKKPIDHTRLVQRLDEEFGLDSAYHRFHGVAHGQEPHPTYYFQWNEGKPFHIDYCFVPWAWGVAEVRVGEFAPWRALSDHRPLVVDLDPASTP